MAVNERDGLVTVDSHKYNDIFLMGMCFIVIFLLRSNRECSARVASEANLRSTTTHRNHHDSSV